MSTRQLLITIATVAVVAGGIGAAVVVLITGGSDETPTGERSSGGAIAAHRVSSKQAADDLSAGMTIEFGGSSYGVSSANCQDADGEGRRFRCTVFVQRGIHHDADSLQPDNGIGARYGIAPGQGAEAAHITVSYSEDGATISWSPGGGSALVADLRERERRLDEFRRGRESIEPTQTSETTAPATDEDGAPIISEGTKPANTSRVLAPSTFRPTGPWCPTNRTCFKNGVTWTRYDTAEAVGTGVAESCAPGGSACTRTSTTVTLRDPQVLCGKARFNDLELLGRHLPLNTSTCEAYVG